MNTNHSAGADGYEGSNLQHTLWMWTIIQRGLQENEGRDCAVLLGKQTNLILCRTSPQDQTLLTADLHNFPHASSFS